MSDIFDYLAGRVRLDSSNINKKIDFGDIESCRYFLNNMYIGDAVDDLVKVEYVMVGDRRMALKDIPDDQIIQRAKEIRSLFFSGLRLLTKSEK